MKRILIPLMLMTTFSVWSNEEEKNREIRDRNIKRLQSMSGPSYAVKIQNAIKPNIIFNVDPKEPKSNLRTTVLIEVEENGLIKSRKIVSSSGNGAWDASVINALDKTQRIPTDIDGKAPPKLEISFIPF